MRSRRVFWFVSTLILGGCLVQAGCNGPSSGSSQPGAEGAAFLLDEEPSGARGVAACRTELEGAEREGGDAAQDVVLVGRIGGLSHPTWEPGRAVFMLADLALEEHEDEADGAPPHDADNCPFCRAEKKKELAGMAMIRMVDQQGNTPAVGAQELLGLTEGQTVVVRGTAELDKLGMLVVRTSGLFIRPDGE